jgi:hypothetical protein
MLMAYLQPQLAHKPEPASLYPHPSLYGLMATPATSSAASADPPHTIFTKTIETIDNDRAIAYSLGAGISPW